MCSIETFLNKTTNSVHIEKQLLNFLVLKELGINTINVDYEIHKPNNLLFSNMKNEWGRCTITFDKYNHDELLLKSRLFIEHICWDYLYKFYNLEEIDEDVEKAVFQIDLEKDNVDVYLVKVECVRLKM